MPLHNFLDTVPYPLTAVLIRLGPVLAVIRYATDVVSWSTSWYDSFLVIAAWWGLCLFLNLTVRFLLPIVGLSLWFIARRISSNNRNSNRLPPITETALQTTITDLTAIQTFISSFRCDFRPTLTWNSVLRVCTLLYIPYLTLTHFVPLRIIIGILGTVVLSWASPWCIFIRSALRRSAWCRWGVYHLGSFLTGQPLPPQSRPDESLTQTQSSEPANILRFLFTVYENQRWWMGLDFTAALLPSERPSWSTQSQQPIAPPSTFTLPEDSVVYLRDQQGRRIKRTAVWRWEEPEWKVLVYSKEDGGVNRVEKPLPVVKDETTTSSVLMKKMKEMNSSSSTHSTSGKGDKENHESGEVKEEDDDEGDDEDILTDADGWIYGDNKWENKSNKGGMGKYTRYRRWSRVAFVIENTEVVEGGDTGIERSRPDIVSKPEETRNSSNTADDSNPLRQRLKSALAKSTTLNSHS